MLINKAIEVYPEERHSNIEEFSDQFYRIYRLILDKNTSQNRTIADLRANPSSGTMNWAEFHRLVVHGEVRSHVYDDFVEPVLHFLDTDDEFEA